LSTTICKVTPLCIDQPTMHREISHADPNQRQCQAVCHSKSIRRSGTTCHGSTTWSSGSPVAN